MKIGSKFLIGLSALVLIFVCYSFGVYNGLVANEENVNQSWSQVENVYQRRADLVPNLISTVKGYAIHEKTTFLEVAKARSEINNVNTKNIVNNARAFEQFQKSQSMLGSALNHLLINVERYPVLRASENFMALQQMLEGTENRIAVERRRYNIVAQSFNVKIRQFPRSIIAKIFNFTKKAYFKADKNANKVPKVRF